MFLLITYKGSRKKKGGGGKGWAIKEKRTFFETFFLFCCHLKNKNYLTLDNLSKYGNITLKFVGRYLYLLVTISNNNNNKKLGRKKFLENILLTILSKMHILHTYKL